ncbi:LLM class flavin-dependent oxidoreductase [Aureimonas fodinaquatilis]|uniref:Luciferase-like monooxygenase n=1 Tax=Aureimonas fodinaquatilis TaxID=2565783 RepID=A0A5B0DWW8_9HYPH|nr:LLM class flavin-dependent oxidoreductase [Aureimonas fodinaquatilis]KAA0969699.1 LLM class flavin-dependent oxidoreductase [Aureimonas fodinaquatilis]
MIPFSVLDLSPIPEGYSAGEALARSARLAVHAENLGYKRFWLAEHHNMPGIASAATAVVIGHVAAATQRIRVGAGGIMLPNHAPLVIAEQFGTLATLFPDRIDLGLGRAPGTDMMTAQALRRNMANADSFPQDVVELMHYFGDEQPGQRLRAIPGVGTHIPVWILGSSLYGAQLAAHLGLPYAFASHFAPAALAEAAEIYRQTFRPSAVLSEPYFMLAVNLFAGADDATGLRLQTSMQLAFAQLRSGQPGPLPRPVDDIDAVLSPAERAMVDGALRISAVGSPESVFNQLQELVRLYQPDEVMLNGQIHDEKARLESFTIGAAAMQRINAG